MNGKSIIAALEAQGFRRIGVLGSEDCRKISSKELSLPEGSSALIALFPFSGAPLPSPGLIAPFARSNHYREIIQRMRNALKEAGEPFSSLTRKQIRLFSNSALPEKEMAAAAGLGFRGRNTLIISKEQGSRILLGGMILPLTLEPTGGQSASPGGGCGTCRLCEESCPGGALKEGKLDRASCLQHWSTEDDIVPDELKEVWGVRIYGCTICQQVCPWNRGRTGGVEVERGRLNPEPDLAFYLRHSEDEIKERLKGSALGMGWIRGSHLIRNALLSAGWARMDEFSADVLRFRDSESDIVRDAALWALKRLRPDREP